MRAHGSLGRFRGEIDKHAPVVVPAALLQFRCALGTGGSTEFPAQMTGVSSSKPAAGGLGPVPQGAGQSGAPKGQALRDVFMVGPAPAAQLHKAHVALGNCWRASYCRAIASVPAFRRCSVSDDGYDRTGSICRPDGSFAIGSPVRCVSGRRSRPRCSSGLESFASSGPGDFFDLFRESHGMFVRDSQCDVA